VGLTPEQDVFMLGDDKAVNQTKLGVERLWLSFGGIQALIEVTFQVHGKEIVGIVGPNGSGKTCILNVISGFYKPQRGEIVLEGNKITGMPPHKIAKLGVGRSFQQMELFGGMTVLENLLVGCHPFVKGNIFTAGIYWGLYQKTELRLRELIEEVLDFMELEKYRKQPTGGLPIGIQKLVGVARALCARPKILLLDEPSCGLSHDEKEDLARFLLRIKYEKEIPIIWVEHDISLVGELADRIIVLDQGEKIADDSSEAVLEDPKVLGIFGGTTDFETPKPYGDQDF